MDIPDDAAILAFERSWMRRDGMYGIKDQAIVLRLRMTPVGYYKRLAAIARDPLSLDLDEDLIRHLRAMLTARHAALGSRASMAP